MQITPELNERLTRVGPGTPMGKVFRSYWIPALLSEEVAEPDGPPVRVRLLGEDLVAFRDTNGVVGLVDAYCAHRRAPLFFGRNEECGLRCVYHGWKFDVTGQCVDVASEPEFSRLGEHVRLTNYPTWEGGGIVWTYMGPESERPAVPNYEWVRVPTSHAHVSKTGEHCNFLQAIEGGIDTVHTGFLHNNDLANQTDIGRRNKRAIVEVVPTGYGFTYAGIRNFSEDQSYVRVYQFCMPNQQMRPAMIDRSLQSSNGLSALPTIKGHIWVPIDDTNVFIFNWEYTVSEEYPFREEEWVNSERNAGRGPEHYAGGSHWLKASAENDYFIDREVQRMQTFTGITGVNTQDYAVQEGMGAIVRRDLEILGSTDAAIQAARDMLLEATDDAEAGRPLRGSDASRSSNIRATEAVIPRGVPWQDATKDRVLAEW